MPTRNETEFSNRAQLKINRRKAVEARTGLARSTIYAGIKAGTFPRPIQLGRQSVGWLESDIDAWLEQRVAASRASA